MGTCRNIVCVCFEQQLQRRVVLVCNQVPAVLWRCSSCHVCVHQQSCSCVVVVALFLPCGCCESAGGDKQVLALLRWPQPNQHKAMPLPLVSLKRNGGNLTLLARSVDEYLHRFVCGFVCWHVHDGCRGLPHEGVRAGCGNGSASACCRRACGCLPPTQAIYRTLTFTCGHTLTLLTLTITHLCHPPCAPPPQNRLLAEEDDAAGPGPISAAAGEEGAELYSPGAVEAEGFKGKFNQYLIRKVGGVWWWLHGWVVNR